MKVQSKVVMMVAMKVLQKVGMLAELKAGLKDQRMVALTVA